MNQTDLQHQLMLLTLNTKLHLAPVDMNIHNVLDVGTGTGRWAIEFGGLSSFFKTVDTKKSNLAEQFPSAHVLGSDLSPIQPTL
jgi:ubiquinone/menaquinone biosynthesis C-methylase UbiE